MEFVVTAEALLRLFSVQFISASYHIGFFHTKHEQSVQAEA